jgi:two-component system, LytTR family, response regulator LytT
MQIVIIEDELLTANDLSKTILSIAPKAKIVAMLDSVEAGINFFEAAPDVDLIFADIELGDGLSLEIFKSIKIQTPIVFCTAYNQYALQAFQTMSIDYILKPFSKQSIENTINKYKEFKLGFSKQQPDLIDTVTSLETAMQPNKSQSIVVKQGDKIFALQSENIALFYIENDYAFAFTFKGTKHILNQSMEALEKMFGAQFFRCNRQHLVNRQAVVSAKHHAHRKLIVQLAIPFKEEVIVGKLKITLFTKWLSN